MGGPKAFCPITVIVAFLIITAPSLSLVVAADNDDDKFPLEGNEWLWCFGKHSIDSRLASDIASSEITSADLKWMNPAAYLVDDADIAGSAPYDSYNDMLSRLQEAYNDLYDSASRQNGNGGDIRKLAGAIDGISSGISKYGDSISTEKVETSVRREMERTGLQRVEEVVPLGQTKTSAAKFYERMADERASAATRERNLAEVERFESEWAGYIGKYAEFAGAEHAVFLNLYNCSKFQVVSLARCNFDDSSAWACFDFLGGCLPWMMCKEQFERDASRLNAAPPNVKETLANLKLHSPLSTLKDDYSEFVDLMKKAREAESSLKAEGGRLADSVESLLLKADSEEELWLINSTASDKIRAVSKVNAQLLSSILKAKAEVRLSSFSATIDKTRESLKGDAESLGKISGREEKYSEKSGAFLYNRIKDLKGINERLAGETTELSGMFDDALELDRTASVTIEEMKASLLGDDALWPLDRLRISNMADVDAGSIGRRVLTKYLTILELERISERTEETKNAAVESQIDEIVGRSSELQLSIEIASSPVARAFSGGMHGEDIQQRSLSGISGVVDVVGSDISKIRKSENADEKNLLLLSLGMKLDSAVGELNGLNDKRHANSLNNLRFSVRKALDDAAAAGIITADGEREKFSGYELRFAGGVGDWIESSRAFGFMGWLEGEYASILKSLNGKLDESSESFFSGLPVEGSYALQDSAVIVANEPVLVRASFSISNPSSITGGSWLYSTGLGWVPTEKIGSKNAIDVSEGIEGVYSGGDRLYLKVKSLKPYGTESALVEYYANSPVRATVSSRSERATGEKYSLEQNISVACGTGIAEIEVPVRSLPEGAGMKITAFSNGRALDWLKTADGIVAVKSSCLSGNHSIQVSAEFAEPIEVSVSRETQSSTVGGGLVSNQHVLGMRNVLPIELRDVEMTYELPTGAGNAKVDGKKSSADGGALYWTETRFAPYGSESATIAFSTIMANSTDTSIIDGEIRSIIDSLPECDWDSCCDVRKLLEGENEKAGSASDPVARYLAKGDFLSWLKKNSPFIGIFSMESAVEYTDLASAKAEMCSLKISKAIEAVRKAEAEKKKRDKEEKAAITAQSLVLRREARLLEERLSFLQATEKAYPGLLGGKETQALLELKDLAGDANENLVLAEKEGNDTRLSEAEAELERLTQGIGSEAKKMADAIYGFSKPSADDGRAFRVTVPGNITAMVEARFPGVVVLQQAASNATAPSQPPEFEKSYLSGDYEGALRSALLDGGVGKSSVSDALSGDTAGKIALASSKMAELEKLSRIKQAGSDMAKDVAGHVEDARKAQAEGRFADASYLALYAYSKAEDEISELAGLKTPIDVRPMAALALLLAAGFVIHKKRQRKKTAHSRKPAVSAIKPENEQQQDSLFFGELK